MHAFNEFYQNALFRSLDYIRRRNTIDRLRFLRKSQFWDRNQLRSWQLEKLNNLLDQARTHSPFYAERLKDCRIPLRNLEEIQTLPILSKRHMGAQFGRLLCNNIDTKDCELSRSGGSTGEPTFYYLSRNAKDWNRGSVYRSSEWAGVYLGDRTVQMMGSHFDLTERQKLKWKFIYLIQRYKDLPVAVVNDELLDRYYDIVRKYKPTSIWGYASGIYIFANFIANNYPNADVRFVKAVIPSSETLHDYQREKINGVFGSNKVFDHYGSREVYMASECEVHKGYHIHSEVILLEVVDRDGSQVEKGDMGRILVTDLSNQAFPFIRYEIGDVGIMSDELKCDCGVTLPKLEKIEGRIADTVVLRDRKLTAPNFTLLMSDFQGVDAYQIVQDSQEHLIVRIVKSSSFTQDTEHYILGALRRLCGRGVDIDLYYVDEIPIPESGKRRYVISNVSKDYL